MLKCGGWLSLRTGATSGFFPGWSNMPLSLAPSLGVVPKAAAGHRKVGEQTADKEQEEHEQLTCRGVGKLGRRVGKPEDEKGTHTV